VEKKIIVDNNTGKLARLLRLIGYDTVLFKGSDDGDMVKTALAEDRVLLTRDRQILKRRLITRGQVKALLIIHDNPRVQLRQVTEALDLDYQHNPFSRCIECNQILEPKTPEEVRELVPPYVFKTQTQYMRCPQCGRVYWRGTHWQAMNQELGAYKGNAA
jgi:uncharacterized protein with PIN domain